MDQTVRIWDIETGKTIYTLNGHEGEVICVNFSAEGDLLLTGSFDGTARIWDMQSGQCVRVLEGHEAEISSCQFEFSGE